jgi:hypothetical protein
MTDEDRRALQIAQALLSGTATCAVALGDLARLDRVSPECERLVHFLYHYAADEDIRGQDEGYAKLQREQLQRLIVDMKGPL